jgi:hypothetical protein
LFQPIGQFILIVEEQGVPLPHGFADDTFEREPDEPIAFAGRWRVREEGLILGEIRSVRIGKWRDQEKGISAPDDAFDAVLPIVFERGDADGGASPRLRIGGAALAPIFTPGPAPVRDLEGFRAYLAGHAASGGWMTTLEGASKQWWSFADDGTFATWIDPPPPAIFEDDAMFTPVRYEGRWTVAHDQRDGLDLIFSLNAHASMLLLSDLRAIDRAGRQREAPDHRVPLEWVDGKLRIEIDGRRYMRQALPDPQP